METLFYLGQAVSAFFEYLYLSLKELF